MSTLTIILMVIKCTSKTVIYSKRSVWIQTRMYMFGYVRTYVDMFGSGDKHNLC